MNKNNIYNEDFLLNRVYDMINNNELLKKKSKIILKRPTIIRQNKKTFITNFGDICNKVNRSEIDIKNYFDSELITIEKLSRKASITQTGILVITGIFQNNQIENILLEYIKKFVICFECSSSNTELIKENRILFLKCNSCKSNKGLIL